MKKIKDLWKHRKYKLYLYYNGVLIKVLKVDRDTAPAENTYVISVWFKKFIFGNIKSNIIVRPVRILKNDDKHHKTYWGVVLEQGTTM